MNTAEENMNWFDSYFELLERLSSENKRYLISKLSASLEPMDTPTLSIDQLYGSFVSIKSAEEIIAEIKGSRVFIKKVEQF